MTDYWKGFIVGVFSSAIFNGLLQHHMNDMINKITQ